MLRSALTVAILASVFTFACSAEVPTADSDSQAVTTEKQVDLAATDGTRISLHYMVGEDVSSSDRHTFAKQNVLRVENPSWISGASANKNIRAVLLAFCTPSGMGAEMPAYQQQLDVSYTHLSSGAGFGYEVQLATLGQQVDHVPMFMTSIAGANHCRQELAVVVDGTWLVDPVNQTHNFRFDLDH
jgi:hypothetical protein